MKAGEHVVVKAGEHVVVKAGEHAVEPFVLSQHLLLGVEPLLQHAFVVHVAGKYHGASFVHVTGTSCGIVAELGMVALVGVYINVDRMVPILDRQRCNLVLDHPTVVDLHIQGTFVLLFCGQQLSSLAWVTLTASLQPSSLQYDNDG